MPLKVDAPLFCLPHKAAGKIKIFCLPNVPTRGNAAVNAPSGLKPVAYAQQTIAGHAEDDGNLF
jgi:hypothetical protein